MQGPRVWTRIDHWAPSTKILVASVDLAESVGLPRGRSGSGSVAYLTIFDDHEKTAQTLVQLRRRLQDAGIDASPAGALGLSRDDEGIKLCGAGTGDLHPRLWHLRENPTIAVDLATEEDPRLLYLIPWIPDLGQEQAMGSFCEDVLFARLLSVAESVVGRAQPPERLVLYMDRLLSDATYGLSDKWRERATLRRIHEACQRFLLRALRPVAERLSVASQSGPPRIEMELRTRDDAEAAVATLLRQDPTAHPLLGPTPQQELPLEEDNVDG